MVPAAALKDSSRVLPEGAQRFAAALQGADQIQLTIGPEGDHLQLGLQVTCRDAASASALNGGLEKATSSLREWIAKEHPRADAADLSGVLLAGTFRRNDRYVYGHWPIGKDVVDAIAAGSQ